jgi:hypothetical protein
MILWHLFDLTRPSLRWSQSLKQHMTSPSNDFLVSSAGEMRPLRFGLVHTCLYEQYRRFLSDLEILIPCAKANLHLRLGRIGIHSAG